MRIRIHIAPALIILAIGIYPTEAFKLYERFPYIDTLLHLAGGAAIVWFLSSFLERGVWHLSKLTVIALLVGATTLIGVLWEFAEFYSGRNFRETLPVVYQYFRGGDLQDTLGDLAADIAGATLLAVPLASRLRRSSGFRSVPAR